VAQVAAITAVGAAWLVIGVCFAIIVTAVTVITAAGKLAGEVSHASFLDYAPCMV
jgi:molybdenum cofactor biosynthesis enzyme